MRMKKLLSAILAVTLITSLVPIVSQAESIVTYEEQDSGTNMGQSFTGSATVVYGQTPSFTVKIPKSITLDSEGAGKYAVGVKGQIPSKYTVSVIPDEIIVMEEENSLLDSITADVTASKTKWTAAELNPDTYVENADNTIQMQSIDYGKFEGTLNFNISAEIAKVELKDASEEVKAANSYVGSGSFGSITGVLSIPSITQDVKEGDIFYLIATKVGDAVSDRFKEGYYKVDTPMYATSVEGSSEINKGLGLVMSGWGHNSADPIYVTYLGESYIV